MAPVKSTAVSLRLDLMYSPYQDRSVARSISEPYIIDNRYNLLVCRRRGRGDAIG